MLGTLNFLFLDMEDKGLGSVGVGSGGWGGHSRKCYMGQRQYTETETVSFLVLLGNLTFLALVLRFEGRVQVVLVSSQVQSYGGS